MRRSQKSIKDNYDDVKIVEIGKVIYRTKGTFYDVTFKKRGGKFDIESYLLCLPYMAIKSFISFRVIFV